MKNIALTLIATAAFALTGCSNGANDTLSGSDGNSYDPNSLAAGNDTQHHFKDPGTGDNGVNDLHARALGARRRELRGARSRGTRGVHRGSLEGVRHFRGGGG
jgi:hypothetical protein